MTFFNGTKYNLIGRYQRFAIIYCLFLQGIYLLVL